MFVVACVLRPGSSRTRCNLMRGSRERGLNLIVCFVLCHVSADGLVLAGFVLSLPRSCLLAHACAWCQATRLASRRSSCMWRTSSRSRALWSLLVPRFCPFLGITPCRFAPILFLVRLPDLPLPPLPLDSLSYLRRRVLSGSCPRLSFVFSRLFKCPDLTRRQTNAGDTCVRTNDRSGVWTCD